MQWLSNNWLRMFPVTVLVLLGAGVAIFLWHNRIWSKRDYEIYCSMRKECHPVWEELYYRRIGPGDDENEIIAKTKPISVERYGEYTSMNYQKGGFTGVHILAKNGRLAYASAYSCAWDYTFFEIMSQQDWEEYRMAYDAYWKPRNAARDTSMAMEQAVDAVMLVMARSLGF